LRKLGGMFVDRLGGACRVDLASLTGRGLAMSFASLVRLRALTALPVLSLSALRASLMVDIVAFYSFEYSFLVLVSVLIFKSARIIAFRSRGVCQSQVELSG
jgi:hypothetical protein